MRGRTREPQVLDESSPRLKVMHDEAVNQEIAELRAQLVQAVGSLCPSWLADRKEDLVQVALMRVMEIQRKAEGKREFSPSYLRRTAYCALVDEIRRLRRRQEVPLDETDGSGAPSAEGSPDRDLVDKEIGHAIRRCLKEMVRPRRLAVTLYLHGHRLRETAELLDWSLKRTENLVYRGLSDLRKCLSLKGLEP